TEVCYLIADCRFQIADCRFQIANCRLQISNCKLQIADFKLQIADCRFQIANCRSQVPCQRPALLIIASRLALNSVPAFHSGYLSVFATRYPTVINSRKSSTAPERSQSGFISSEGL